MSRHTRSAYLLAATLIAAVFILRKLDTSKEHPAAVYMLTAAITIGVIRLVWNFYKKKDIVE